MYKENVALVKDIGKRIQQLREEKNLSMSELAKAVNVSRSLISQVEKGDAYPSLLTLEKIANALGVSLSKFFQVESNSNDEEKIIVRSGTRKIITMQDSKNKYYILSPSLYKNMEFLITEFPPYEEGDGIDYFQHDGEEYFYVLSGQLHLTVGDNTYIINEDDSGCFDAGLVHYFINKTDKTAKIIIACSERGF
jgi:transcriptional regulator with XRE-family HTH domain